MQSPKNWRDFKLFKMNRKWPKVFGCRTFVRELIKLSRLYFMFSSYEKKSIAGNRSSMKGLFIGCALNTIMHFTAYYTLLNYSTLIFSRSDTSLLSPYVSTIVMAAALVAGTALWNIHWESTRFTLYWCVILFVFSQAQFFPDFWLISLDAKYW